MLEEYGLKKGKFNKMTDIINNLRRVGILPLDLVEDEKSRSFHCIERWIDDNDPQQEADDHVKILLNSDHNNYIPKSFWEDQTCFIQMMVEKVDLLTLFRPTCEKYKIPIANAKGWSSMNQRGDMIKRWKKHEQEGRTPVLLYCGDFDPAGLNISNSIHDNIGDLYKATGWTGEELVIDRFGLSFDFIEENKLTWIDNLTTGSGGDLASPKHEDHYKPYVQDYLHKYCKKDENGKWKGRKVEANAIVRIPELGRKLIQDAINNYIDEDSLETYENKLTELREEVSEHVKDLMDSGYWRELAEEGKTRTIHISNDK